MDISLNVAGNNAETKWRSGIQPLLPVRADGKKLQEYDIYPYHSIGGDKINTGFNSLAAWIMKEKLVCIDGYAGVFWDHIRTCLEDEFAKYSVNTHWINTADYFKSAAEINQMVLPYLGTQDSVWGKKTGLNLRDFYTHNAEKFKAGNNNDLTIIIGPGAAMFNDDAGVIYIDLPKNELQLRMRAGSITNLGNDHTESPSQMYKRFYFVDWVVLNEYKKKILNRIDVIADGQWRDTLNWMLKKDLKTALHHLGQNVFRVRPWFEPGAWGGQWLKQKISGINKDEVNYAWSFELIVPENGIVFESDGYLLEVSFDFLMFSERDAVLGKHAERFGDEFPVRFDFLDTWKGGNLSIQCHPSLSYIQKNFGETITQDETYYILDCTDNASVYLGFQEDIDPSLFRKELEESRDYGKEVMVSKHIQCHQAHKHDLYLIPNGTVHSAGAGNLVLEISATPYIFTFKMYDWLRLDLNGEPRAINIEHAFNNLRFERKGDTVTKELISKPAVIKKGQDWELVHLPTHSEHFYDVHRIEFDSAITIGTEGSFHVLMLVEGTSISVRTQDGRETVFHYAETFVIPAAAKSYALVNTGDARAKVIKAFIKPQII